MMCRLFNCGIHSHFESIDFSKMELDWGKELGQGNSWFFLFWHAQEKIANVQNHGNTNPINSIAY